MIDFSVVSRDCLLRVKVKSNRQKEEEAGVSDEDKK